MRLVAASAAPHNGELKAVTQQWHNEHQAQYATEHLAELVAAAEAEAAERARFHKVVMEAAELRPGSRVLDVGCGCGTFTAALQELGDELEILAVDVAQCMVDETRRRLGTTDPLGNTPGVRVARADAAALPAFYGPFDGVFFHNSLGNTFQPYESLRAAALALRPGGKLVLAHAGGRGAASKAHDEDPVTCPHVPPSELDLRELVADLPLQLVEAVDDASGYCMVLQVAELYALQGGARFMEGEVVVGYGRGSKQMGVPTANINPEEIEEQLDGLHKGVYFGWAKLQGEQGPGHMMVMNVGNRPTFVDGDGLSVEAHVMHEYSRDFHGERMRVVLLGYVRPEMRFDGLQPLLQRIFTDMALARSCLGHPMLRCYQSDDFLANF